LPIKHAPQWLRPYAPVCCLLWCVVCAQGESSTGTHQSLAGLGEVCKRTGTLLLVDTVCCAVLCKTLSLTKAVQSY
jgi:cysteine sulfinate desulfinase/cysteine desulfurase-like protein